MANYKNHLVDPFFFYDAIQQFAFTYDFYRQTERTIDDQHRLVYKYEKDQIIGSLQTEGLSLFQNKRGNTQTNSYKFYCKSLYRISIGDFIFYKDMWLHCSGVHEYDEWGVREADLEMVQLSAYRDLAEYVKYLDGEKLV